jgi:hypothetical protein
MAFALLLVAMMANIASAETLAAGATVCQAKEGINAVRVALDAGNVKKYEELISSGKCRIVNGDHHVAVTNACGNETRKILLDGDPVWCLTRHLR